MQLVERKDQVHEVARSDSMLGSDDRDDIPVGAGDMEQLLAAEVFDHVGPRPE